MNFATLLDVTAEHFSDDIALEDERVMLTYRELAARINRCANFVASLQAGLDVPEVRVGILANNDTSYVEILFGCLRANITCCLLNTRLSADEVARIVEENGISILVVDEQFREHARRAAPRQIVLLGDAPESAFAKGVATAFDELVYERVAAALPPTFTAVEPQPDDTAVMMFTSGTTGFPKAVRHTHRALVDFTSMYGFTSRHLSQRIPLPHRDVFLCILPIYHVSGITALYSLVSGGYLILRNRFTLETLLSLIDERQVTRTTVPQTVLSWMLSSPELDNYDLSSLTELAYGGSQMSRRAIDDLSQRLSCELTQAYGSTEVLIATILTGYDHLIDPATGDERAYSVGRPMIGAEVSIVNGAGEPLPAGQCGFVRVSSPVTRADGVSWVDMGDTGYLDEQGFLHLLGRRDDLIISGGENVYPAEIENCIRELRGQVAEVTVIGVPDEKWGESPLAFVVREAGCALTEQEVIAHCEQRIARYKRPRQVVFVDELPINNLGKVSRTDLRSRAVALGLA